MSYLQEFQAQIKKEDLSGLLHLWEEYCCSEEVNIEELVASLEAIRESCLADAFGEYVELVLPLWQKIEEPEAAYETLTLIIDLQTTNSQQLADIAYQALKQRYGEHKLFNEKMRLVGMRQKQQFRGALRNYDLLTHLDKGAFVFHTGGWGTGEVLDYSLVREELVIEFEYVVGKKYFTFENAFKHLIPLPSDHFLARRFGDPDALEAEAREHPVKVIQLLLRNLGPKTAAEIKEEICELVIPEGDWTKWWQSARSRLKKNTRIETPSDIREPFRLRDAELSHEDRFRNNLDAANTVAENIQVIYNFSRDFSEILKNSDLREHLKEKVRSMLSEQISGAQRLQLYFFQESLFTAEVEEGQIGDFLRACADIKKLIDYVDIIAFKKRALVAVKKHRDDWVHLFLEFLVELPQTPLRDYVLKELNTEKTRSQLEDQILNLRDHPARYPEAFVWYFQKIMQDDSLPESGKAGQGKFFEQLLILLNTLEQDPDNRDMVKKIYGIISGKRFETVRNIIDGSDEAYAREFLLLVTKCHSLSSHDKKVLHALAEVVHPSLADARPGRDEDEAPQVIWTTQEGYDKIKEQIERIGTVEIVDNAKEIEAARELGDLRENSEYKFALERRARLQAQLKMYSDQVNRARILTEQDISVVEVGVGTTVQVENDSGENLTYTLLGPWDADPDKNILSFQSKLAQAMFGTKEGETFSFQDRSFTVRSIQSYLEA